MTCISVSFSGIGKWLGNIEEFGLPGVPLILLGNKADLEGKREVAIVISTLVIMLVQVERERGEALAREHSMAFLETSARTGVNVAQVSFFHLISNTSSSSLTFPDCAQPFRPFTVWRKQSWTGVSRKATRKALSSQSCYHPLECHRDEDNAVRNK